MTTFHDYWMYPLFFGGEWEPSQLHGDKAEAEYLRKNVKEAGYRVGRLQRVTIEYEVPKK